MLPEEQCELTRLGRTCGTSAVVEDRGVYGWYVWVGMGAVGYDSGIMGSWSR